MKRKIDLMIKGIVKTFLTFPLQQMIEIALRIKSSSLYSAFLNELDIDANLNSRTKETWEKVFIMLSRFWLLRGWGLLG